MSWEAAAWAAEQRAPSGGCKLLLMMLANSADTYGCTFVGQVLLAERCQCERETVSRNMAKLRDAGLIASAQRRRANGSRTSDWTVLAPNADDRGPMGDAPLEEFPQMVTDLARVGRPEQDDALTQAARLVHEQSRDERSRDAGPDGHVTPEGGPDPSVEPSAPEERARASASNGRLCPQTVDRKPVKPEECELAWGVMDAFNAVAGAKFTAKGFVEKIIRRIREHPELDLAGHHRVISATFNGHHWWGSSPDPRIIYGNDGQFEKCLAAAASGSSGSSVQSEGVQTPSDGQDWNSTLRYD